MGEFFKIFFDGNYADGLGEGTFGHRHLLWILATIVVLFILYFVFRKHKKAGLIFIYIVAGSIFIFRFFLYAIRFFGKTYDPQLTALSWHMCSLVALLMPIVIVLNLNKFKTAIYTASIMGAFVTLALGDYFDSRLIHFFNCESMFTHSFMLILPFLDIAIGRFKFEIKRWWEALLGTLFFIAWASLANEIIFKGLGYNYMYLKYNALPFSLPNVHFFVVYVIFYAVFVLLLFGVPYLHRLQKIKIAKVK